MSDTDHGTVSAIVLAAGHGTRMRSNRPKPLHRMCGRPIVLHAIWALCDVLPERTVVVVGNSAERVTKRVQESSPEWANVVFAEQAEQRGTGDAALTGLTGIPGDDLDDESTVVVLPGDAPLLLPSTIVELVTTHVRSRNAATVLTAVVADPTGYGRVIRGPDASVRAIVEERDADDEERQVTEINTSVYAFRRDLFGPALRRISPHNAQSEYYLTDVIAVLSGMGHRVGGVEADAAETRGVNDRWQLALAERELRARTNRRWLLEGVTMLDPRQTFVDVDVQLGRDVTLYPGTILEGTTTIGDHCTIGPQTRLTDCAVGVSSTVANTVGREAEVGSGCTVGPFAALEPGTHVADGAVTGAFYTEGIDQAASGASADGS